MKPKNTPNPAVFATTTVSVKIQGKTFILSKQEAQELAKALTDAVGLPPKPESKEESYKRVIEDNKPPLQWPRPLRNQLYRSLS